MRLLVTGAAGFVGSRLVPYLLSKGHETINVDLGIFGTEHCDFPVIIGDIGKPEPEWFEVDAVINLAGLSTDPQAEFSPELNFIYNAGNAVALAYLARKAGVGRFIQGSTCSIYGDTGGQVVTEDYEPPTDYAYGLAKIMSERGLQNLQGGGFEVVILRKGTICGFSPRFRTDLAVNTMVKTAVLNGIIEVHDSTAYRPLLHIDDACQAYERALSAKLGTYNLLSKNYNILELAVKVQNRLWHKWGVEAQVLELHQHEVRNYRASVSKLKEAWGWVPALLAEDMVDSVMENLPEDLDSEKHQNIACWKKYLRAQ